MKKIFATAFVGASALALAACAGEAPADEAVEGEVQAVPTRYTSQLGHYRLRTQDAFQTRDDVN